MRKMILAAMAAAVLCAAGPAAAQQQPAGSSTAASDALGQCLVGNSTGNDRMLVARWMGASLAMSPAMKGVVTVDAARKDEIDRAMAKLFTRLLTVSCKAQMAALIRNRDAQGIEAGSGKLGEMAMRELMQDPAAMQALIAYARYIDPAAMQMLVQ